MRTTTYQLGLGIWLALPALVILLAAAAHAGWSALEWAVR